MTFTDNFSREEGVAFIYSVKLVKYLNTSTHVFQQHAEKWRSAASSANQPEKRREKSRRKNENFFYQEKGNERLAKDMAASKVALKKLRIMQTFDFEDHNDIYSFDDLCTPINQAPIEIIDGTVPPPSVTSYPEYPVSEYSTKPAFNVHVEAVAAAAARTHRQ